MAMSFSHSGNCGDLVFAIPTILSMTERFGGPANLYIKTNVPADYYEGRNHPLGNVRMDRSFAEAIIALLKTQPVFDEVAIHEDQQIDVDLDLFRCTQINYAAGYLARFYFYAFQAHYDLSQPWLWVEPDERFMGRVVVNRTGGYRNPRINYAFLDEHDPVFLGLPREFEEFEKECPRAIYQPTKDFLAAAKIIKSSKVFVGNQSSLFAIAEGLKVARVLEVCLHAPNVIPHGPVGRDAVNQLGFMSNVRELLSVKCERVAVVKLSPCRIDTT